MALLLLDNNAENIPEKKKKLSAQIIEKTLRKQSQFYDELWLNGNDKCNKISWA